MSSTTSVKKARRCSTSVDGRCRRKQFEAKVFSFLLSRFCLLCRSHEPRFLGARNQLGVGGVVGGLLGGGRSDRLIFLHGDSHARPFIPSIQACYYLVALPISRFASLDRFGGVCGAQEGANVEFKTSMDFDASQ